MQHAEDQGENIPGRSPFIEAWIFALVLACGVLVALRPAMHGEPIWDDDGHMTPPALQSWKGLGRIWFDLKATQQYYPLTHSLFWLEHRLWGDNTYGYHLLNALLHIATALLFWRLLVRLRVPGATLAAALFALHPVQVESVAWISELKNTLSGVFCLSAALIYLRFDETRKNRYYLLALGLFLLGLASKSVIATLPAALLVIFWWKRGRLSWRRDVLPLLPFLFIGVGSGLFTAWVERAYIGAVGPEYHLSVLQRVLIAGRALCFYFGKIIWPAKLIFIYPRWHVNPRAGWQYLYPIGVVCVAGILWAIRHRWRGPLAAFLLFAGILVPVLGFVNVYPFRFSFVADHFQYLATMPVFALFAAGFALMLGRLPALGRWAGWGTGVLLLVWLGHLSWLQSHIYTDQMTLYNALLDANPTCWLAYSNRGNCYYFAGNYWKAIENYDSAIRLKPDYIEAYSNRGASYNQLGRFDDAMADLDRAIELKPDFADAYRNRGNTFQLTGHADQAIADYSRAIKINPQFAQALSNRGATYSLIGRLDEGMADLNRAIELQPGYADPYSNRAGIYFARKDYDRAWADIENCRRYGGTPNPVLLRKLIQESGRDQ